MAYDQTVGTRDFGFLPANFNGDVQVFLVGGVVDAKGLMKWVKPRGVTMCYMICIGAGGGGGGGATGATTTARGGGGGGFSGAVSNVLIPAIQLPDVLWIQVVEGGKGGAAGIAGGIGANNGSTFITYGQALSSNVKPDLILIALGAAAGGGAGTSLTGGAGASGGAAENVANLAAASTFALQSFFAGANGTGGGAQTGAVGTDVTAVWNIMGLSGGAGGAGVNTVNTGFAGGNVTIQAAMDFADGTISPAASYIAGGTAGGVGAAGNGNSGVQLWKPFYMTGGSGGGSSDKSTGGNGGNGGIGCGGGGGGGGTTGGTGGNGGGGCAIIISW